MRVSIKNSKSSVSTQFDKHNFTGKFAFKTKKILSLIINLMYYQNLTLIRYQFFWTGKEPKLALDAKSLNDADYQNDVGCDISFSLSINV